MLAFLKAPRFDSPEQTQRSRILYRVLCGTVLVTIFFVTLIILHQPATLSRGLSTIGFVSALGLAVLGVNQRGQTRLAAVLFGAGLIALMSALAVTAGGVRSPGVTMYFVIVLMVGLLAGEAVGTILAIACGAIGLALLLAENAGLLPPGIRYSSTTIWLLSCLYMGVVVALLRVPAMLIKAALFQADSDLSERRKAEQSLQENKQILQTMIENTPAAVAMFDTEMRYIAYSRRWLTDYRLGNRDLRGLSHYEVFPEIGEEWKAVHRRCLGGARVARDADSFLRSDGTKDFIRWVVQPWFRGSGEIGGITMFTEVITDRVRNEEERRVLREQLLEAQKMEALGTLAGGIAHDFNNILAIIGTNAVLGLTETTEDPARTSFLEILQATNRAKDVVRQILFFSRRQKTPLDTISVLPVVEDAMAFLHAALPSHVEIRKDLKTGLPPIRGNASQIYQIVLNLGTNAGHAMPAGGTLDVGLDLSDVTIAEAAASRDLHVGRYVRITMQDTGTGMDADVISRIFEPFFTTRSTKGTGLGLSVVHGIVKDHGGAVRVESEPGKGSAFRVYFPAELSGEADIASMPEAAVRGHGQHIMYVDDEKPLGSAMKRIIESLGYRCTICSDPIVALALFRNDPNQFDAVIVDVVMPRLSGFELAEEMRAIRADIPVAVTSGNFSRFTDDTQNSDAVEVWISKPATMEELGGALATLLRGKNLSS
ncbi:MAG TPA: ATP-binding protein [Rhizomicrobium sp.]|nr:ATP-binding protein [Rhizomicrobium sp.]